MVPQHGQGAVGEAARTVMVTSVVIRTCSIRRSERSGMMVIGSHWIWKTSRRRTCLVLQYTTCAISGPAEEPNYGISHSICDWEDKFAVTAGLCFQFFPARLCFQRVRVLPLSVVENSAFSPNCLTISLNPASASL